jgi:hypothetical protein
VPVRLVPPYRGPSRWIRFVPTVTDRALSKPSFSWSGGTFGYPDTDTPTEPRRARANASAQPTRQVLAQSRKKRQDLFRRV